MCSEWCLLLFSVVLSLHRTSKCNQIMNEHNEEQKYKPFSCIFRWLLSQCRNTAITVQEIYSCKYWRLGLSSHFKIQLSIHMFENQCVIIWIVFRHYLGFESRATGFTCTSWLLAHDHQNRIKAYKYLCSNSPYITNYNSV